MIWERNRSRVLQCVLRIHNHKSPPLICMYHLEWMVLASWLSLCCGLIRAPSLSQEHHQLLIQDRKAMQTSGMHGLKPCSNWRNSSPWFLANFLQRPSDFYSRMKFGLVNAVHQLSKKFFQITPSKVLFLHFDHECQIFVTTTIVCGLMIGCTNKVRTFEYLLNIGSIPLALGSRTTTASLKMHRELRIIWRQRERRGFD